MKKIFVFVGTNRLYSNTMDYVGKLIQLIREDVEIDVDIISGEQLDIRPCKGCLNCFINHFCPLDSLDGFNKIKEKMLEADFIIFASPVFLHNVTGCMKNFLDRISYWSHIFRLRGKNSMVIASAGSNGTKYVIDYLTKILNNFGCPVVEQAEIVEIEQYRDNLLKIRAEKICGYIDKPIKSNDYIEQCFSNMKSIMCCRGILDNAEDKGAEYLYWEKNGMIFANSLEQVISEETK